MTKEDAPLATLSLDLDNEWSYLKIHGDPGWENYPSYFDLVVPRALRFLEDRGLTITWFVVGQDAALAKNESSLAAIAAAGHEIGSHSFHHEPWLHRYTPEEIDTELAEAEQAIEAAMGCRPIGFRGPGFSLSLEVLSCLERRGYRYDASTLPTFIGPLARAYYFFTAKLPAEEREKRKILFGGLRDGLRPIKPYRWNLSERPLLELPVTTMPVLRAPFHLSYLIYLATFSKAAARFYFRLSLAACRVAGVPPSLLLHPLDFLGCEDVDSLKFFPGMAMPSEVKLALVDEFLSEYVKQFRVLPLGRFAEQLEAPASLPLVEPVFP